VVFLINSLFFKAFIVNYGENGTYVNDVLLTEPTLLKNMDLIKIAKREFRFEYCEVSPQVLTTNPIHPKLIPIN